MIDYRINKMDFLILLSDSMEKAQTTGLILQSSLCLRFTYALSKAAHFILPSESSPRGCTATSAGYVPLGS